MYRLVRLITLYGLTCGLVAQPGAVSHAERARGLMLSGCYVEALEESRLALRLTPSSSDLHNLEGLSLDALGRHEEARAAYENAIRLRPGNWEARSNLAYNLASSGRSKEAQREFDAALKRKPAEPSLHLGRGILNFELGDASAACQDFAQSTPWPNDTKTLWIIFGSCLNADHVAPALSAAPRRANPTGSGNRAGPLRSHNRRKGVSQLRQRF